MKPGKRLSPICLTDKETCLPDYTTCVVTGWGNNDRFGGERFPSVLQDCDQNDQLCQNDQLMSN